nr:MAG TPA: hypothetical protein [Caudoviricetes sp.]
MYCFMASLYQSSPFLNLFICISYLVKNSPFTK